MSLASESVSESAIPMHDLSDAMDCSLALTSQEIESEIVKRTDPDLEYHLVVEAPDFSRALETVQRFREENRRWRWRRPFSSAHLEFRGSSLIWCIVLGLFGYLPVVKPGVLEGGILDSARVFDGEWWRIATATMLHRDVAHLFSNLSAGFVLFGLAMGRFGVGVGLLAIFLTGVGGNLSGLAFHLDPYRGLGASGAVMGALGMLGPHAFGMVRADRRAIRLVISGLLGVVMLFVLFGLSPQSDVIAHLGGFATGIGFGAFLALVDEPRLKRPGINLCASVILLAGLLWAWGQAVEL